MSRAYHAPLGDPCKVGTREGLPCGMPLLAHEVEHQPKGQPCRHPVKGADARMRLCGLPPENHARKKVALASEKRYTVGIDGEGQGDGNEEFRDNHRYVMMAWASEDGTRSDTVEAQTGGRLSTVDCLEFILRIPYAARAYAFAFNYDLTKILEDVDDGVLWLLFRPERRQRGMGYEKYGPKPVEWKDYLLNLQGSKFSVARKKTGERRVIWDVFKFYQAKFTSALDDWYKSEKATCARCEKSPELCARCAEWLTAKPRIEHIRAMKDKRSQFNTLTRKEVRQYCLEECQFMAGLTRKLVEAHEEAGFKLHSYHGAGSTAGAVLKSLGIDKGITGLSEEDWKAKRNGPPEMRDAIAASFFGGRFEHSVIGRAYGLLNDEGTREPIYGLDISAAYPYQLTFLPCLECGTWEHTTDRNAIESARTALVRYSLSAKKLNEKAADYPGALHWGPFPFRNEHGAISFPAVSGGGWVWRDEYLAGERLWPHVDFHEAWIYKCDCDHKPFERIPELYRYRLKIGKEGPGIVVKLGTNACYGKIAQSLGTNPPFQSWIWASMITSGTRAQILDVIGLHKDWRNVLAIATDGIYTRENVTAPAPRNTDTAGIYGKDQGKPKPLGGWEKKAYDKGMVFIRPGIYFPADPSADDLKLVRARGIGRAALLEHWKAAIEGFESGARLHWPNCPYKGVTPYPPPDAMCECPLGVRITHIDRFHGAKSSISIAGNFADGFTFTRGPFMNEYGEPITDAITGKAKPRYGQWQRRIIEMNFSPLPKRERINPDGTLAIRYVDESKTSAPYENAIAKQSDDALALKFYQEIMSEQPDGEDFSDYWDYGPPP